MLQENALKETRRRLRYLQAVVNGEKPKGDPKSYVRLGLLTVNEDGSYSITQKGVECITEIYPDILNGRAE